MLARASMIGRPYLCLTAEKGSRESSRDPFLNFGAFAPSLACLPAENPASQVSLSSHQERGA